MAEKDENKKLRETNEKLLEENKLLESIMDQQNEVHQNDISK